MHLVTIRAAMAATTPSTLAGILRRAQSSRAATRPDLPARCGATALPDMAARHRGLAFDINQTVVGRKRRGFTEGDGFHSEISISAYTLIYSQIFIIIFSVPVPHAVNQCIWATAY